MTHDRRPNFRLVAGVLLRKTYEDPPMPTSVSLKLPPVDLNSHFFMKIVRSVVCGVVLFVVLEFRVLEFGFTERQRILTMNQAIQKELHSIGKG